MSLIRHILTALAYAVIAVAAALAAPQLWPHAGQELGAVLGGVVFVGCALLHEARTRQDQYGVLALEINDLRQHLKGTSRQQPAGGVVELQPERVTGRDVDDMVAEVKVLQTLVADLSREADATGGPAAPSAISASVPREAASAAAASVEPRYNDDMVLDIVRDALRADRVDLVFQPIVSLPQRKQRFYEAFTRIRDANGSAIGPDQYIGLAESEGLVGAIDNMLLFKCVQLVRKAHARNREVGFFCNISPHSLADKQFFDEFVQFLGDNRDLASGLIFEFAQSLVDGGNDEIKAQLARLASMGFRFSMDQVTKLSFDLDALAERQFRFVKVDAEILIAELEASGAKADPRALKRSMDRHAIDLIAGKIESESALRDLLDLNIDFGQGYLFGEPKEIRA